MGARSYPGSFNATIHILLLLLLFVMCLPPRVVAQDLATPVIAIPVESNELDAPPETQAEPPGDTISTSNSPGSTPAPETVSSDPALPAIACGSGTGVTMICTLDAGRLRNGRDRF